MDPIAVKFGPPVQSDDSAEAAIAAATNHPLQPRAKADAARFAGRRFVGGRASLTRCSLEFTGPLWVEIWNEADEVRWEVLESPTHFESNKEPNLLIWPSGQESTMNPVRLFDDRVGAAFWSFFVNESGFLVYMRQHEILSFHPIRRADDESCILYVGEEN